MKNILLSVMIMNTFGFAEIVAKPSKRTRPSAPVSKPMIKNAIKNRASQNNGTYYNGIYHDGNESTHNKEISEKNKKIEALENELNATRRAEHQALQKKNKADYDKEMKEFDNRKSSIQTENIIIISDKP